MRLRSLGLLVTLGLGLLAASLPADAQQAGKVYRIGVMLATSVSTAVPYVDAFRQGLRELGWVEGKNFALEIRAAEGKYERFPAFAAELVRLKVDVIAAAVTSAAEAAKNATRTIPIVMLVVADPVGSGLVASLARPGGNVTGASLLTRELTVKRLELLREAVPGISRVAYFWRPGRSPVVAAMNKDYETAARATGVDPSRFAR